MTDYRYEVLDNNLITVPLVFPVTSGKRWNTNVLNTNAVKDYEYTTVNESFFNGDLQYDSTVSILQFEEENLIEQIFERETHAKGVGLIFREHKDLETEFNGDIRSGFESEMRLISFK
jgi:fibronectin type 3 domain-containing protein